MKTKHQMAGHGRVEAVGFSQKKTGKSQGLHEMRVSTEVCTWAWKLGLASTCMRPIVFSLAKAMLR